jgi:hypothetical protein
MVDYVQLPVPTTAGDQVASDEIGGLKYQRVKLIHGADGVNDGDVSTVNPLPVEIQGSLGTADTKALGSALVSGDVGLVTNTVIHGVTTAGGGAYVDVKVNPSGALTVDVGESVLPTGAATDATLVAINSLQSDIRDLNDTLVTLLSAIFEKMPRVTGNDQAAVSIESGTVAVSSLPTLAAVTTVATVSTVTNQAQLGGQEALTIARAQIMSGTSHIYNNIEVS